MEQFELYINLFFKKFFFKNESITDSDLHELDEILVKWIFFFLQFIANS